MEKIRIDSIIQGEGAYETFKKIVCEFYEPNTYKFVGLTLNGNPTKDNVEFTAEFWPVNTTVSAKEPAPFISEDTSLTKSKWEYFSNNGVWTPRCSNCGYVSNYTEYNYCPNCGAKMNNEHGG